MADETSRPKEGPTKQRASRQSRRQFLQGVAGIGATVAGLSAVTGSEAEAASRRSQPPGPRSAVGRVGILFGGMDQPFHAVGIREIEGTGIEVVKEYGGGEFCSGRLGTAATALLQREPDVLITTDTPGTLAALAARRELRRTDSPPIVAAVIGNPVLNTEYSAYRIALAPPGRRAAGMASGLSTQDQGSVPGLYGVALPEEDDAAKRLRILADALGFEMQGGMGGRLAQPLIRPLVEIAFVTNYSNPGWQREWLQTRSAESDYNLDDTRPVRVHLNLEGVSCAQDPNYDTAAVVNRLSSIPNLRGVLPVGDAASHKYRNALQDFADNHVPRLPTMWESLGPVNDRGTLCWGPDRTDAYLKAARIAVNIVLRGQYPPPEPTDTVAFKLYANRTVAQNVGLGQAIMLPLDGTRVAEFVN